MLGLVNERNTCLDIGPGPYIHMVVPFAAFDSSLDIGKAARHSLKALAADTVV